MSRSVVLLLSLLLLVGHTSTRTAAFLWARPRSSSSSFFHARSGSSWSSLIETGGARHTATALHPAAAAATTAASTDAASPPPWALFDPEKAIQLAAFSFATYGDPSGSRWMRMPDGTDLGFQVRFLEWV